MDLATTIKIMDQIDPPDARVILVMVPTRAIRIIALMGDLVFRVEQLDSSVWKWRTLSSHKGDEPWEALEAAFNDANRMQARLKEKVKLAQHEASMARMKALNSTTILTPTESLT